MVASHTQNKKIGAVAKKTTGEVKARWKERFDSLLRIFGFKGFGINDFNGNVRTGLGRFLVLFQLMNQFQDTLLCFNSSWYSSEFLITCLNLP